MSGTHQSPCVLILFDVYGVVQLVQVILLPPIFCILVLYKRVLGTELPGTKVTPAWVACQSHGPSGSTGVDVGATYKSVASSWLASLPSLAGV